MKTEMWLGQDTQGEGGGGGFDQVPCLARKKCGQVRQLMGKKETLILGPYCLL